MRGLGGLALLFCAALVVIAHAPRAPAEQCIRTCPAGAPRDGRGCCISATPAGKAPAGKAPGHWVRISAGTFSMGSPSGEVARDTDENQHRVTLSHDFSLLDAEVIQSDFQRLMGYNPSDFTTCGGSCPVETVNWHEAAAYTNVLSRLESRPECYTCTGQAAAIECEPSEEFVKPYQCPGYRLPTEAEWEYAARAGTTSATYGGELDDGHLACEMPNLTLDRISWFCGNSSRTPHQVKTRDPNAWRLYDMLGNVYEWCHDWYHEYQLGGRTDPWGPPRGTERIVRGGSWCCSHNRDVRAAERMSEPSSERHSAMGFRVARTLP